LGTAPLPAGEITTNRRDYAVIARAGRVSPPVGKRIENAIDDAAATRRDPPTSVRATSETEDGTDNVPNPSPAPTADNERGLASPTTGSTALPINRAKIISRNISKN